MKKGNNYFSEYVSINGIDQYLLHYRSTNPALPVLLFIHGGPGLAESTFSYAFQKGLCDLYTVVYWDQRGAGKTLTKNKNLYPSIEESLDDMQQVVNHLKTKYAKEQIVILGHSFGSMLGSLFVLRHPDDVIYYIGAGQVINIIENERIGYEKLEQLIRMADNKKDLKMLKEIGMYPESNYEKPMIKKIQSIRMLQGKYKIGMDFILLIKTLFKSPIFRISDLVSIYRGMSNNKSIWNFMFSHSLYDETLNYQIPVYYIIGERDFQAPRTIAQAYFDRINAPEKQFLIIKNAGHFMMLDQPEAFTEAITAIGTGACSCFRV